MPLYYFNLKQGPTTIHDPEGTELPDAASAREHATVVARELMQNNRKRTRTWRLQVCDSGNEPQFEVPFASIGDRRVQDIAPALRERST